MDALVVSYRTNPHMPRDVIVIHVTMRKCSLYFKKLILESFFFFCWRGLCAYVQPASVPSREGS